MIYFTQPNMSSVKRRLYARQNISGLGYECSIFVFHPETLLGQEKGFEPEMTHLCTSQAEGQSVSQSVSQSDDWYSTIMKLWQSTGGNDG